MARIPDRARTLTELTDQFLNDYFAFYPTTASGLGLHEYDGRMSDLSAAAIQAHIERLQGYRQQVQTLDPDTMNRLEAFDYALLHWQVEFELWQWADEREYRRNPMLYAYDAMIDGYIKRNYAPLRERAIQLTAHLTQIPQAMQTARANLELPLPRVLVEEALSVYDGLISFLQDSLQEPLRDLNDTTVLRELWAARDEAIQAFNAFQHYLRHDVLPTAHDDFAIGAERFAKLLRYGELIDLPLDRLLAIGEADLQRNRAALQALAHELDPHTSIQQQMQALGRHHPPTEELVATTRSILDDLRAFVIERDLLTLPEHIHCLVMETPAFARWAFAMMETAGPFEDTNAESFYYITLPEPGWSPEQVESWLTRFDYATLIDVSMHEAYPGHLVHFTQARNAPTRMAKVFAAYTHYESWAHYCEQMMLEQGYGSDNPQLRLAHLAETLIRNCRYVCAIKMHTQGMTVAEATRFFRDQAYMDELTASKEARRGTYDPGYINYTLGKLLLLKLLEDYRAAQGERFSLKQFHDEYIGYGAPPIPILRRMLLPPGADDGMLL